MKVCVVMDNGFEELEAMGPIALLRRAGLDVDLIGIENDSVTGRFGVTYSPVIPMDAYDFSKADCLVLPGGPHWQKIEKNEKMMKYDTGIAVEIPPGYVGLLFPRSSVCKTGLSLANGVGVIDQDFRGSISFVFYKNMQCIVPYFPGDRIGQLVIVPIPAVEFVEAEELSETERGAGGYGSTGK